MTSTKLTLSDALRVITADGRVVGQTPSNMLWFSFRDVPPSDRQMIWDMTEGQVIELGEAILWNGHQQQKEG